MNKKPFGPLCKQLAEELKARVLKELEVGDDDAGEAPLFVMVVIDRRDMETKGVGVHVASSESDPRMLLQMLDDGVTAICETLPQNKGVSH